MNAVMESTAYTVGVDLGYVEDSIVTPTRISKYGQFISAKEYGGKAASLYQLISGVFLVPDAWVIACEHSLARPKIDLYNIPWSGVYAVRSGAPVSMPGLLKTELNVKFENIEEAVHKVWDSWNSDHAIAYREQKGIAHDLGTGVIIQEMVPNIAAAGVAFTNHPTNTDNEYEFNPIIEYVDGVGEALVSGESSGKVASGLEPWYFTLHNLLRSIHNAWGPSDVEWCADTGGKIYFVQQRALKFTQPVVQTVVAESFGDREVLGILKPIGAPKTVSGVVVSTVYNGDLTDKILYVSTFDPSYYKSMMKAKAIICQNGGETCHAAILGREMGKVAVSGADFDPDFSTNLAVVINGSTGVIYKALPEDLDSSSDEVTPIVHSTPRLRPNIGISQLEWSADKLLFRFYKTINDFHTKSIPEGSKNEIIDEIAHIMSSYFYIICVCELRHLVQHAHRCGRQVQFLKLAFQLGIRNIPLPTNSGRGRVARELFLEEGIPQPENLEKALEVLQLVYSGFTEFQWYDNYGGDKWGIITKMVQDYLTGELTSTMFVDMVFNLQHNGGRAFNKFSWMLSRSSVMSTMLTFKAVSYSKLETYAKSLGNYGEFVGFAEPVLLLPDSMRLGPDEPTQLLDTPVLWPCGCERCECHDCYPPEGKCSDEDCYKCNPCDCYECGCKKCFRSTGNMCKSQDCDNCACDCGECDCSMCNPDEDCGDDDCNICHPCDCKECGCERCYVAGECDDKDCNTCNPCECGECGCERCYNDGNCDNSDCSTCNPCGGCLEEDCEQCHQEDCECPKCYVDPNQGKLDLVPELVEA